MCCQEQIETDEGVTFKCGIREVDAHDGGCLQRNRLYVKRRLYQMYQIMCQEHVSKEPVRAEEKNRGGRDTNERERWSVKRESFWWADPIDGDTEIPRCMAFGQTIG